MPYHPYKSGNNFDYLFNLCNPTYHTENFTDSKAPLPEWKQCGGKEWGGPTVCQTGCSCKVINEWYSQCEPNTGWKCEMDSPSNTTSPATTRPATPLQ